MLDFITKSIGKIFGTKYDRDVAKYTPIVEEINAEFERLKALSFDELRNRTLQFRERIAEHLSGVDADIKSLTEEAITIAYPTAIHVSSFSGPGHKNALRSPQQ